MQRRRVRGGVHDLRAQGRRRRRRGRVVRRACRLGRGFIPRIRPPTFRSRLLAAEITREKLYLRLHDELPYATPSKPKVDGAQGRLGQDRPGDLCRARGPEGDRAGQRRPRDQGDRRSLAARTGRDASAVACICSCSSRCARTGPRRASITAPSASNSRKSRRAHGMERRSHRAVGASAWRNLRHPGSALTRAHGMAGIWDSCGAAHRAAAKPTLQPGNTLLCALARAAVRASRQFFRRAGEIARRRHDGQRDALAGLNAFASVAVRRCPSASRMKRLRAGEILLDAIAADDFAIGRRSMCAGKRDCWRRWASASICRAARRRAGSTI
jgi:hypothetical protein